MARAILPRQSLFNTTFDPLTPMFWIHIACIQAGGKWRKPNGEYAGNGMFYHYKEAQKILWPEKLWHRWNDLLLEKFLEFRIIGVMGPASSGKTREAADFALISYYAYSDCMTVLVSSTEREMLEMRVWGEMKKGHKLATSRIDGLPGNLVESRQRLITDDRFENSEGRDFRNGVCAIPCKKGGQFTGLGCFTKGTLVDTVSGPVPIEQIQPGDLVLNAAGIGRVCNTQMRTADRLIRVHFNGGYTDCTPGHPFLTQWGWVKGVDLTTQHRLISADESVQILRDAIPWSDKQSVLLQKMQMEGANKEAILQSLQNSIAEPTWSSEILLKGMSEENLEKELCFLWNQIHSNRSQSDFLFQILRSEMENEPAIHSRQNVGWARLASCWEEGKSNNYGQLGREEEEKCPHQGNYGPRTQNETGSNRSRHVSRIQFQHSIGAYKTRSFLAELKASSGDRRAAPCLWPSSQIGQVQRQYFGRTRVEGVEVLKRSSGQGSRNSSENHTVYNLEVEGHPSYSVNGVLVHNSYVGIKNKHILLIADEGAFMPRAYVDAISNLNKNAGFKCIVLGNPKETTDALGVVCEPSAELGGWDGGIDQGPKTKSWPTRFKEGVCVQLVGSDCPNMDVPKGAPTPYPFLITREAIEADIAFYGMDSLQFSMMNEGRMPRGQGLRRVITRAMCLKFGAMEPPVWKNEERTRIGFMDAAYGSVGGDRCVFGELQFGRDCNDREILALIETMLVPVSTTNPELPEDQIALFIKDQCEARHIKPENFFFDSTGRGTLVGAFARLWSANVGLVEFGGKASERYVSDNIRVLCRDYYSKFVTELWYSVSLTIQSGQFRGLTEDVMLEGSMREWGFVGANKIEVEPKDKMKLKCGRSPDLFDALAAGVEGARRRGFHIAKLSTVGATADNGWRLDLAKRMERLKHRHTLNYSA